MLFEKVMSL